MKTKLVSLLLALNAFSPAPLPALDVALTVTNRQASVRPAEPITAGVPFSQGVLGSLGALRLLENGSEIPAQFLATARWPDGSVRWVLADFQTDLGAGETKSLTLQTDSAPQAVSGVTLSEDDTSYRVNTGAQEFVVNKNQVCLGERCFQAIYSGTTYNATPESWLIEEQGPLKVMLRADGVWRAGSSPLRDDLVRFRARLVFYRQKDFARLHLTFRNNNSHGWQPENPNRKSNLSLTGARFGSQLMADGNYIFGNGVEKTWEVVSAAGGITVQESRYNPNGTLAAGFTAPRPLALASPQYYAATGAFGKIALPLQVQDPALQADLNRFEKLQRSKVLAADVEDQPGKEGVSVWGHMYQDLNNWNHYGGLRWGGDFGPVSDNHYDWSYGMYLQMMRSGLLAFADAARVFARHETDFAVYHTNDDGPAFNYQRNWESRPSSDSPDNGFGGGRPSHTWVQGAILHYLLTGDPRGKDAFEELREGIRQYVYEAFNIEGYIATRELRIAGWLAQNLVALWRVDPEYTFSTTSYGTKTIPQAIKDVLKGPLHYESADGGQGYVYVGDDPDANHNLRQPLMNLYFLQPAIDAYREVFKGNDAGYAADLLGLIRRMTDWTMSITMGGSGNSNGYLPRQIPYIVDVTRPTQEEGQIPYILMAADAAAFMHAETGTERYLSYARANFQDYARYLNVTGGDSRIDPAERSRCSYNSSVYVDTESKIHGWSNRYGQYYLAAENGTPLTTPAEDRVKPSVAIASPKSKARVKIGSKVRGAASDNVAVARVEFRFGTKGAWKRASGTASWSLKVPKNVRGKVTLYVRAVDSSGNRSASAKRALSVR